MTRALFNRGLLLALCELRSSFITDGPAYHEAFRQMLKAAVERKDPIPERLLEDFDPVFGVFPQASEMILEGMRDCILTLLSPQLVLAQFRLSRSDATRMLDKLDDAAVFRALAHDLDHHLPV